MDIWIDREMSYLHIYNISFNVSKIIHRSFNNKCEIKIQTVLVTGQDQPIERLKKKKISQIPGQEEKNQI